MRLHRLAVVAVVGAQVVGGQGIRTGPRKGSGARFEAPYTFEVETPHVKWARRMPGWPIKLLAVPTVSEGRTVIELAQRLTLELTTVTIDPHFDANKWTMAFGRDYGARAEKGDLSLIYSYLESELTSDKKFDAILLPLSHGWERLTPASREALARRVRGGCGLVLVRPFESELSPLVPPGPVRLPADASAPVEPGPAESSPWRRTSDHYITRAIPVESFPFKYVQNYVYRAAPDATVLIRSESGNPVLAVRPYGKGRVVAFAYKNAGLSWQMPMSARGLVSDLHWEYFYAMLCRALIYAAGREPATPADFTLWRLKTELGQVKRSGMGRPPSSFRLAPGRYFLEQQAQSDWHISVIDIPQPDKIENLRATPDVISEGDSVEVSWHSSRPALIELSDGLGRVIARGTGREKVVLKAGRPLVHSGFVRATVGTAVEPIAVRFAASTREWSDYEVIMPWYGPGSYQPWIPALDEQFRRIGLTTLASPDRNFKFMASVALHDEFGVYSYRAENYRKRKAAFAETRDKKYLTRDVVLQSPGFEARVRGRLERLRPLARLHPLAYYLADESSLTSYTDAFDVDWAPEALAGFRVWLRGEYSNVDALNASWGTAFRSWDEVVPMTTEEAQKHGNFAPWSDHRVYMEQSFVRALGRTRDMVRETDPGALASISGTQIPTAHNGCNWYQIDQRMDYLQPYSGGNQDAMHHLFRPGIRLTGFTGYQLVGTAVEEQQWRRLFYGHTGASIFWHYTLLNPDLSMSEQGKALAEVFGRLQSGIGRVFMNSTVHEDGVAIHFSMASIRGAWIQDGTIRPSVGNVLGTSKKYAELVARREGWVKELERQGVQFRFLASEQIEAGELDKFRVLILPYSIALSDKEVRAIDRFVERGGVLYADEQTGRMDERCHWRKEPKKYPVGQALRPPVSHDLPKGDFLVTIRDFGRSRLTGLLPRQATTISRPATRGVIYDLLRGQLAAAQIEAAPERPALLVERATRVARLEISDTLALRLTDDAGKPVDRSVARIEVFDPAGRLVRHYSSNVSILDGRAKFQIPFALNDPPGRWRVRARDVISGLTAERALSRGRSSASAPVRSGR